MQDNRLVTRGSYSGMRRFQEGCRDSFDPPFHQVTRQCLSVLSNEGCQTCQGGSPSPLGTRLA
jgi:hypothetical protein